MEAIGHAVISEAHGKDRQGATGISIYFPAYLYAYKQSYGELDLSQQNLWSSLIMAYYNASGRMVSGPSPAGPEEPSGPNDARSAFQADTINDSQVGQGTGRGFDVKDRY